MFLSLRFRLQLFLDAVSNPMWQSGTRRVNTSGRAQEPFRRRRGGTAPIPAVAQPEEEETEVYDPSAAAAGVDDSRYAHL
eukprot:COSAG05_NODE_12260_length_475_cov_0.750000_1_plen_79_part_10